MLFRMPPRIVTLAATMAFGLHVTIPSASSGTPLLADGQARYLPVQSISYEFGSKSMSGYFIQHASTCLVTLMIMEKGDAEGPPPPMPARIRLLLHPGQIAGLDSEEGRSLNITCGDGGTALLVDAGERDRLVEIQAASFPKIVAQPQ